MHNPNRFEGAVGEATGNGVCVGLEGASVPGEPGSRSRTARVLRSSVIPGLTVALAVSLWGNWKLARLSLWYYQLYNRVTMDPVGADRYPCTPVERQGSPPRTRVVFYGDSRAAGWIAPSDDRFEFINRGVGGQSAEQVTRRFVLHVAPLRPDVVVIQVGVNDLKTIPLFPDQQRRIVDRTKARIEQLVVEANTGGSEVILTTIFPCGSVPLVRRLLWSAAVPDAIVEVNQSIRALASDRVRVLDAYALLVDRGFVKAEYELDTLHLNASGYRLLNRALSELLAQSSGREIPSLSH